jgi:hypothetical protein
VPSTFLLSLAPPNSKMASSLCRTGPRLPATGNAIVASGVVGGKKPVKPDFKNSNAHQDLHVCTHGSECTVPFLKSGLTGFHPPGTPEANMAFSAVRKPQTSSACRGRHVGIS